MARRAFLSMGVWAVGLCAVLYTLTSLAGDPVEKGSGVVRFAAQEGGTVLDKGEDLWESKDVVPENSRKWLPEIARVTGLTRVWTSQFGAWGGLPEEAERVIKAARCSSVYTTRLPKRRILDIPAGKRSEPEWQEYAVRRYGRLLVAFEVIGEGKAKEVSSLHGFDASSKHAEALDTFYQLLQTGNKDKARYEGKELITFFHRDPELWFHLAALDAGDKDSASRFLTQIASAGALKAASEARKSVNAHPQFQANSLEFLSTISYSTEMIRLIEKSVVQDRQQASDAPTVPPTKAEGDKEQPLTPAQTKMLPPKGSDVFGSNEVRVRNPNTMSVVVGLRSKEGGRDFAVCSLGVVSVTVPDGEYGIYFVYSDKPDALFQGDGFALKGNGVEIHLVQVIGGNYGIRRVK